MNLCSACGRMNKSWRFQLSCTSAMTSLPCDRVKTNIQQHELALADLAHTGLRRLFAQMLIDRPVLVEVSDLLLHTQRAL